MKPCPRAGCGKSAHPPCLPVGRFDERDVETEQWTELRRRQSGESRRPTATPRSFARRGTSRLYLFLANLSRPVLSVSLTAASTRKRRKDNLLIQGRLEMRTFNKTILVVLGTAAILALASQATADGRRGHSRSGYHRSPSVGFRFGWSIGARPHYVQHRRHHFPAHRMISSPRFGHRGHLYTRPHCGMSRRVFAPPRCGIIRRVFVMPRCGMSRSGYAVPRHYFR